MKPFIRRKIPCLLLMSALSFSAQAESAHWQQTDYILNSFNDITLNREHGGHSGQVNKWLQPIRYQIDDRTGDQALHQRMVSDHLYHLASITGLDIKPAAASDRANLRINFASEQDLDHSLSRDFGLSDDTLRHQIIHDSVCLARVKASTEGEIKSAGVIIPVDRARAHGKLMSCIVEELTQVLGLVNDSNKVFPSIFNDRSFNDFLSGLDYILLKLLYEPEIGAGMRRDELEQQLRLILSRPASQSLIDSAEQAVRQHSLENWLN